MASINLKNFIEKFMKSDVFQKNIFGKPIIDAGAKNPEILKIAKIYNEYSLQHELGIFLRRELGKDYQVQFERNVEDFGGEKNAFVKKRNRYRHF